MFRAVKNLCQSLNHLGAAEEEEMQSLTLVTPPLLPPLVLLFPFPYLFPLDMCHILGFCSRGINARLHGVVFLSVVH